MRRLVRLIPGRQRRQLRAIGRFVRHRGTPTALARLGSVSLAGDQLRFTGTIYANSDLASNCTLVVRKFREEQRAFSSEVRLTPLLGWRRLRVAPLRPLLGMHGYRFDAVTAVPWKELPASVFGVSLEGRGYRQHFTSSVGVDGRTLHTSLLSHTLHVFREPSVRVVRIESYHLGQEDFEEIEAHARAVTSSAQTRCVIGEYTNAARDNGVALFSALRDGRFGVRATYVVERTNLDGFRIDQSDVVEFGSREHLRACVEADVAAFTHHRTYVYPHVLRSIAPERYDRTRTFFLQHGVMAMKRSPLAHYRRGRVGYDAVAVSSDLEAGIFQTQFRYRPSEVFVTGLVRFDALHKLAHSGEPDGRVLVFPTWRKGIEKMPSQLAAETPFVRAWRSALQRMRTALGTEVTLMLHPILQRHAALFEDVADEVALPTSFQSVLVRSACLITDYSSVSFDALYCGRATFLYQFDREEYGLRRDAFIDVDSQSPGQVATTEDALIDAMLRARSCGWRDPLSEERSALFFARLDDRNAERAATVIRALGLQVAPETVALSANPVVREDRAKR